MSFTATTPHPRAHRPNTVASGGERSGRIIWALGPAVVAAFDVLILAATMTHGDGRVGWLFVAVALAALVTGGSYGSLVGPTLVADAPGIIARLAIGASLVGALGWNDHEILSLLRALPLGIGAVLVGRSLSYALVRRLAQRARRPVLIVGAGKTAVEYATTLERHPEYGLRPVGFVDEPTTAQLPLPLLGGIGDLQTVARQHACRDVIVAFGQTREADMVRALRTCEQDRLDLWIIPRLHELGVTPPGPRTLDVWGLPLVAKRHTQRWRHGLKRSIDVGVAALFLMLTAPLCAACALAVKLSSPGPIFFRQRRVGQHGQDCELLKFRTMRVHDWSDTAWTADDHVTRIGKILRATSADELPQLWNVLRGDMSLVGPRPERPHFADGFAAVIDGYTDRTRMPVGMTGWAQVHGLRGDTSIAERVRFDNRYIEQWSVLGDVAILAKTVPALLRDAFGPHFPGLRTLRAGRPPLVRLAASVLVFALVVGIGAVAASASTPGPTTYSGSSYVAAEPPTQDKPQSKLWHHDGSWWGLLESQTDHAVHVFELSADHTWRDTGVRVSSQNARGDALAVANRVYVASRTDQRIEVTRLSYSPATRRYSVDGGFPRAVTNRVVESVSIARDSTGELWLTFTHSDRVWVATSSNDGTNWSSSFNPPGDSSVAPDDISTIVAYEGHIGVMWSDQRSRAYRFAPHRDTDKDSRWRSVQTPLSGTGIAEDHMNLHADGGRIYAVVKTARNDFGGPLTDPISYALVRDTDGSWDATPAWTVGDAVTRPIALIDHTTQRLHLFATAPESGGKIYTKSAPLDAIAFAPGRGDVFIASAGHAINNSTSTKQDVTSATGIVVLASAHATKRYFHTEVPIIAADVQPPTVPTGVSATALSSTSALLDWQPSTDDKAVTGYRVIRDDASVATVSAPGFRDDSVSPTTTYSYRVVAFDEAGNASVPSAPATLTMPGPGEVGIDFRAASSGHGFDTRSLEIPSPDGAQPGDVLLASIDVRGNPAITAPNGWAVVREDQNAFVARKATYVRTVEPDEPASYTWSFSQTQSSSGVVLAYTGVDASAPIDAHGGQVNAASSSIRAPEITSTVDHARIVGLYSTAVAASIAPPPGADARGEAVSDEGIFDIGSAASDQLRTTAGPTGSRTATASLTAANIGQLIALRPGAA